MLIRHKGFLIALLVGSYIGGESMSQATPVASPVAAFEREGSSPSTAGEAVQPIMSEESAALLRALRGE